MIERLSKGAGLSLLAIPMANAFVFTNAISEKSLNLDGGLPDPGRPSVLPAVCALYRGDFQIFGRVQLTTQFSYLRGMT